MTSRPPINPPLPSVGAVAFTAKRATPYTLASPSQVKFDDVVTNVGFGFDSYNGYFDSPEAGVYVFSWSGVSPSDSHFRYDATGINNSNRIRARNAASAFLHRNIHRLTTQD